MLTYFIYTQKKLYNEYYYKINKKVYNSSILYPTDYRKKNLTTEKMLINFLMKNGNFYKTKNILKQAYVLIYNFLLFNELTPVSFKKKYVYFNTLSQIITYSNYWCIFNNLISYFLKKIKPLFFLKSVSLLQKFKKKKKDLRINTHKYFLCKVPERKRLNFTVREFYLYTQSINRFKCSDRLCLGLMNIYFYDKKSFLYLKKLQCYKKVLSNFISTGFSIK